MPTWALQQLERSRIVKCAAWRHIRFWTLNGRKKRAERKECPYLGITWQSKNLHEGEMMLPSNAWPVVVKINRAWSKTTAKYLFIVVLSWCFLLCVKIVAYLSISKSIQYHYDSLYFKICLDAVIRCFILRKFVFFMLKIGRLRSLKVDLIYSLDLLSSTLPNPKILTSAYST